jgi:CheY-like chemotaxis protein
MKSDSPIYVLVVEDEFLSRLHAVNLVEDAGYKAIEASNSEEAIAILEARKDIRIVFTDVDMPGTMDGLKLAHAIRTRWPPVELIVTSGHFNLSDADMPERGRFISKPYRDQDIVSAIHHFVTYATFPRITLHKIASCNLGAARPLWVISGHSGADPTMSALPLSADMLGVGIDVCFVPLADIHIIDAATLRAPGLLP